MRKTSIAATAILGLSAFAASVLVGQQQEVQALSLGEGANPVSSTTASSSASPSAPQGPTPAPTATDSVAPSETSSQQPTASPTQSPTDTAVATGQYQDGEFTSSAVNYKYGTIQLGVTVSNGAIASIDLIQATTRGRGYDKAPPLLVDAAISAQGTNFGNLTGATYSTQAFKKALENALEQATRN